MNRKLLAVSVAALAAGNVHAAADFDFAIAGATAPTNALGDVIATNICQSNTQVVVSTGDAGSMTCCHLRVVSLLEGPSRSFPSLFLL